MIQSLYNTLYEPVIAIFITGGVARSSFIAKMKGFRVNYLRWLIELYEPPRGLRIDFRYSYSP
nr:MAG TPA: hypothetical protein [Caudoviricetes sp.]